MYEVFARELDAATGDRPAREQRKKIFYRQFLKKKYHGAHRDSNPGPSAPKAEIIPLDYGPSVDMLLHFFLFPQARLNIYK